MVTASMNEGKEKALAYVFGLGNASPREWHLSEVRCEENCITVFLFTIDIRQQEGNNYCDTETRSLVYPIITNHLQDLVLDIPVQYREKYSVTSGHKVLTLESQCGDKNLNVEMNMQSNYKLGHVPYC